MNALFVDYEFCTGCHACEVACQVEHGFANKHENGITVFQMGPWNVTGGKVRTIYNFVPVPTDLCDLCSERVKAGRLPNCVHHCQAACLEYGPVEEMAKKAVKAKSALFMPQS